MFTTIFKGTAVEFRFRLVIHLVIYFLGCIAPWTRFGGDHLLGFSHQILWSALGFEAMRLGIADFGVVTVGVTAAAVACATLSAVFRVWGAAYIGTSIVQDAAMHPGTSGVVADGPYRHVRNPLYLGTMLFTVALTLVMPVSGAIFAVVAIAILNLRLIGGEEAFLTAKLGGPYLEYMNKVPRLLPSLRAKVPASGERAHWGQALLGEFYFVAVAVGYASLAWTYNSHILGKYLLIVLGVSFIVRAFVPRKIYA